MIGVFIGIVIMTVIGICVLFFSPKEEKHANWDMTYLNECTKCHYIYSKLFRFCPHCGEINKNRATTK